MNWIDRLSLVWGVLLWLFFGLLANGHGHPEDALNVEVVKAVLLLAVAPWLILRGLQFIVTGGRFRRS